MHALDTHELSVFMNTLYDISTCSHSWRTYLSLRAISSFNKYTRVLWIFEIYRSGGKKFEVLEIYVQQDVISYSKIDSIRLIKGHHTFTFRVRFLGEIYALKAGSIPSQEFLSRHEASLIL